MTLSAIRIGRSGERVGQRAISSELLVAVECIRALCITAMRVGVCYRAIWATEPSTSKLHGSDELAHGRSQFATGRLPPVHALGNSLPVSLRTAYPLMVETP